MKKELDKDELILLSSSYQATPLSASELRDLEGKKVPFSRKRNAGLRESFEKFEKALDKFFSVLSDKHGDHDQSTHGRGRGGGGEGVFKGKKANPDGKDTEQQYRNPDGSWTPERQALHDKIVAKFKEGKTPVDEPVSYMMGGGPAAGKTTMIESGDIQVPDNHVLAAGDDIKGMLPEFKAGIESGDMGISGVVHEESAYLSKRIAREASEEGYNVLMDGTGDSSIEGLERKVALLKGRGQRVEANYATVPTQVAVDRSTARAERTGRSVPESVTRASHAGVSRIVPEAMRRGLFDEISVYDTSTRGDVVKIASAKGKDITIHDQVKWDTFLAKGNE